MDMLLIFGASKLLNSVCDRLHDSTIQEENLRRMKAGQQFFNGIKDALDLIKSEIERTNDLFYLSEQWSLLDDFLSLLTIKNDNQLYKAGATPLIMYHQVIMQILHAKIRLLNENLGLEYNYENS